MEKQEKPDKTSARKSNRETLASIARLISLADETDLAGKAHNDDAAGANSGQADKDSLSSLNEPGASQLLEALPAGLAICEGNELLKANSAFALAFGYRSCDELKNAGGLRAIFPGKDDKLAKLRVKASDSPSNPSQLPARTCSGREFTMPVAIHPIPGGNQPGTFLLVLHPGESGLTEPEEAVSRIASAMEQPDTSEAGKETTAPAVASQDNQPTAAVETANAPAPKRRRKKKRKQKQQREQEQESARSQLDRTSFLAKVSHELRTPLNSIIGFAEIMKEEQLGPVGNERYRGYIHDILESGVYALSLVNDLLDISKIEAGEFEMNFTSVDLDEVITESLHSMQPQAKRQRVLLRTNLGEDLPAVLADRRSIRQIILNLVSNAIKFTKPGGQVIVSTQATGAGGVRIRVRDTGIGMTRNDIERALKPFKQVDTAPRKEGGTGLGLPLTRALVEANRARFKLRSVSESGTRIDVTFPPSRLVGSENE